MPTAQVAYPVSNDLAPKITIGSRSLRPCRYLWAYESDKETIYLANLLNHAVVVLRSEELARLKIDRAFEDSSDSLLQLLVDNKFLVDDADGHEEAVLRQRY